MKKITLFAGILLMSLSSGAHIKPGSHKGKTSEGSTCEMNVGKTYFEKDTPHPLNERIEIQVNEEAFIVQHPSVISVLEMSAYFDHDQFQGVIPNSKGAKALVVKMEHSENFEGPSEFHFITHEYKSNSKSVLSCKLK